MKKLSILIVAYNSSAFIDISLYALSKLTSNEFEVFILDSSSLTDDYKKLEKICKKYNNCYLERWETNLRGSLAHGTALNYLVKKVSVPYFSILDADAIWLKKDWDKILIRQLDDEVKVVGTEADGEKPKDFPLMYAILFETETFKKINIDFRPKSVMLDTGHELRDKYLGSGYKGRIIKSRNTRYYKEGPFRNLVGVAEHYLDGCDGIFSSHFGRGSTLGVNKYMNTRKRYFYKIPVLGDFFIKQKGRRETNKWINICKGIINDQINIR